MLHISIGILPYIIKEKLLIASLRMNCFLKKEIVILKSANLVYGHKFGRPKLFAKNVFLLLRLLKEK